MSKLKTIIGVVLVMINLGIGIGIYSLPFSSDDEFTLPNEIPKNIEHLIVFCGFIQCPTICPNSLRAIRDGYTQIAGTEFGQETQVVFVNLMPQVEHGQTAQEFAQGFHQDFTGWQLGKDSQKQLIEDLHTFFLAGDKKRGQETKHSPNIYLLNRSENNKWKIGQIYTTYPAEQRTLVETFHRTFNTDKNEIN